MNRRMNSGKLLTMLLAIVLIVMMLPAMASAKLEAPRMKKVTAVEKGIKVEWYSRAGAAGYRLFRKDSEKGEWKAIADLKGRYSVSYTDTKPSSGKTNYYAVRALYSTGKLASDYSTNPKKLEYYKTPQMKSAAVESNGILVKWGSVSGAKLFRISRQVDGGSWKAIGTTSDNEYLDKKVSYGSTYAYRVRVVTKDNKTVLSNYDHTPVKATFSKKAAVKSVTTELGDILVTWNSISGASQYRLARKVNSGDWFTVTTTSSTQYKDTDVLNNVTYTYRVQALDGSGNVLGDYDTSGKSTQYFVAPTMSGCGRSDGNLVASWKAVEGVSNYSVYRRIGSGTWMFLGNTSSTSYTDSTMPSGTWCEYTVACANDSGANISGYGASIAGAKSYFDTPVLTSISNGIGNVTLSWRSVDNAQNYIIYRKIGDEVPEWTKIGTTTGTSYTDASVVNVKKYTYTVAVRDAGDTTDESMYNETGLSITYYDAPQLDNVSNGANGVVFSWKKVEGVSGYNIWRKTGNGSWTNIGSAGASASSFTDNNVVSNGHYNYSVSSVADSESAYRTPGLDTTFYAAPASPTVQVIDGGFSISWNAVDGVGSYRLERSKDNGNTYPDSWIVSSTSYSDTTAASGTKYRYRVCCMDGSKKVSGYGVAAQKLYLSKTTISTASSTEKGKVTLKWDAVTGAESYEVYYKEYTGDNWTPTEAVTKTSKELTLTSGEKYSFKVVVANGNDRSVDSATKTVTVK